MPVGVSYMPTKEADQIVWAARFVDVVCQNSEDYGVPSAMATAFIALNNALKTAWAAALDPATRTRATVATKNTCMRNMKAAAKPMISIIQGTPGVTDAMLINAGLTVRKTTPSVKPAPVVAPYCEIVGNVGRTVTIELRQSKVKRGKPANVTLATIFTHVGETPPMGDQKWQFLKNTSLTTVVVPFGPSATGGKVWICAFWQNAKGEGGPSSTPASIDLPAGSNAPMASANEEPSMKLRAA